MAMEAIPEQEQQTLTLRIHGNIARDNAHQWNGNTFTGNTFNITNNHQSTQQGQGSGSARDSKPRVHPPRRPNSSFIGQEHVLKHMRESLLPSSEYDHEPSPFVLQGIGGVGKSEIVLQFVERHKSSYWGLFWVDLGSEDKARATYSLIAKRCGWPVFEGEDSVSEVVNRLGETDEPWLLILDNCDKPDIDYSTFLPRGPSGSCIITTRLPEVANVYGEFNKFEISGLDERSAITLLLKGSGSSMPPPAQSFHAAMIIAKQLDCHSLAVTVAASMLRKGRYGLEEYSKALKRTRTQVELLQTKLKQDMPRYGTAFATFEISAEELLATDSESGRHALELLSMLGFLDQTGVPEDLITRAWAWGRKHRFDPLKVNLEHSDNSSNSDSSTAEVDQTKQQIDESVESAPTVDVSVEKLWPSHFADALDFAWSAEDDLSTFRRAREILSELSLIFLSLDKQVITMHPLLHSWARQRLSQKEALSAWSATAATLCLSMECDHRWREFTPLLRPHFESCFELWPDKDNNLIPTLEICSTLTQFWWQLYRADSRYCMDLVDQLERRFPIMTTSKIGRVDENHISVMRIKANTLYRLGDYPASLEIESQMVVTYQEVRSEDDIVLLTTQNSLALSFLKLGQTQQALEILREIVRIGRNSFPPDHDSLLDWQHSLGRALNKDRQFGEAVKVLENLDQIERQKLSFVGPDRLWSQYELGRAYLGNEQRQKAIEILEEAVQVQSKVLPPDHLFRLRSQHGLAWAYHSDGQFQRAIEILEEVVRIESEILPLTHRDRLDSQQELARAYLANGQSQKAIKIFEEVVRIRSEILLSTDKDRLTSQHLLGEAYLGSKQPQKAVEILEEVVQFRIETQLPTEQFRLSSQHVLGRAYLENEQFHKATEIFEEVVRFRTEILSPTDSKLLNSQHELARAYKNHQQISKAICLLEHVVEMEGGLHPRDRYSSGYQLIHYYIKDDQAEKARILYDHVNTTAAQLSTEDQEDLRGLERRLITLEREQEEARVDASENVRIGQSPGK